MRLKSNIFLVILGIILLNTGFTSNWIPANHAISYEGGSRFGDRVLGYFQARYLSFATGIDFLYRPFPYSQYVTIDYQAKPYDQCARQYRHVFHIRSAETLFEFFCKVRNPETPPTLFIVDYFPTELGEWDIDQSRSVAFDIPWEDSNFKNYLKQTLSPRIPIPDFRQPGCLNVATHVRTLSGDDTAETVLGVFPLKFPPLDYQKNQIKRVYEWNLRQPMHVFIFSDSKNPIQLVEDFRQTFNGYNISFNIQIVERPDLNNVIQDFFAMQKFDVLIATQSNFSLMAAHMGSFDMTIIPIRAQGRYPQPSRIDRVQLITKESSWFPYTINTILKDE